VAQYSGPGNFPYWMTIAGDGTHANPSAISENIPVQVGTTYSFTVTGSFPSTFAGGVLLTLAFYTAAGALISTAGSTSSGSMTGGTMYALGLAGTGVTGGFATAPALSSYAVATIEIAGTPAAANPLSVFQAEVSNGTTALAVNLNFAYTYTFWPWSPTGTGAVLAWNHSAFLAGDSDSLVLDGQIELMGGQQGVQCMIPELLDANGQGPTFRILAPPSMNSSAFGYESSYDLNAPQPTQDVVASMLLDGERPFGARASNRTMTLPVVIFGTYAGGMAQVLKAREYLMSVIDQSVWQIKWTAADTGLPLIFDAFRALPSVPLYGFNYSAGGAATGQTIGRPNYPIAMITLSVQALPYGRSDIDGIQSPLIANSLANYPVPPASALTVDAFGTSPPAVTGWNYDTTTPPPQYTGHSVHWSAPRPVKQPYPSAVWSRTLGSPVNITGLPVLSLQFGQSYDTQWPASPSFQSNVTLYWTLTDSSARTLSFSTTYKKVTWGANPTAPKWTAVNAAIPQGKAFGYSAVTAYKVTVTNWSGSGYNAYVRMHCWLNNIVANPPTVQNPVSPRGNLYNLFTLPGTARSPVSIQCQLPASASIVKEITTPASGNWIVPPGVYTVAAEAWAAGGAGAATSLARALCGGGGGGGEYAGEPAMSVLPGAQVPWSIGGSGLPSQLVSTVVQFTTPGLGHWTCPANVTSVLMETWGGGGSGGAGGGGGGGGGYGAKTQTVVPGTTYYVWVGKGGKADTGTSGAQNFARVGGGTWVGSSSRSTYFNALVAASPGNTAFTGGTSGGFGATNTAAPGTFHYPGGRGGGAPGPSGGGGGGAAGSTGPGGPGGNSQPFTAAGRWQTGGNGGTGTGQGGNGGTGANTPGFPGAGVVPGGGGGGGYQTSPLYNAANPSSNKPGSKTVNFLGGDGANGMVQFTYAIGGGSPVTGSNTTFGSAATTFVNGVGTIVTAHGGQSAAVNSATGAAGGTGSGNTNHSNGGAGGLLTNTAMGSYLAAPSATNLLTFLSSAAYNSTAHTTGASAASVAQGTAIALIESTAQVADLTVTDSAGNIYQPSALEAAGGSGVTLYAYVANIEFPVTTSTTLTLTSATSQEYGVLWYASPWLTGGVTSGNSGVGSSVASSSFTGQFGTGDTESISLELGVVLSDGSTTVSGLTQTKTWFNAGTTNSLAAGTMNMAAYVMENQGGGNGNANTGDTFSGTLSGAANWAVLCVPLTMANQQNSLLQMDLRTGTTPGSQTTWATEAAIQPGGMILVVGQSGTGTGPSAGPSAMADASGNHYTKLGAVALPGSGGGVWAFTAPVTAGLAAGTTGTYNWGAASAAPNYWTTTYSIPNATALDTGGLVSVTGTSATVSGSYTPAEPNEMAVAVAVNFATVLTTANPAAPWNYMDSQQQSQLGGQVFAAMTTDEAATAFSANYAASQSWALLLIGFQQVAAGSGGGAAGGPGAAGYPGIWQYGGPGYAGGSSGKGGAGASAPAGSGGGAGTPGGGGGGALGSSAGSQEGGQGGPGMIRLTWTPPLTPFNTLLVHSLGRGSNPNVNPCCPVPITDQPNNTEYFIPSVNGLAPAAFSSTYTVLLANYIWNSATSSSPRQITVTVNQYEYPGGPRYSVQVSRAITPATDIVNGIVNMGEVTLPVKDYVAWNDQSYFTVSINDTDLSDVFMDVLFLDTLGQTFLVSIDPGNPGYGQYVNYFFDEATPDRDLGFVGASFQDRQHSVSVLDSAQVSGGPLYVSPGDNLFFVYSTQGAPNLAVTYSPRWYLDRSA
jgi:hypothetical protein